MNLLEKIGIALRDGVYEVFMSYASVTDLKELKSAGFEVKELPLSPHPANLDKLYILSKSNVLQLSCSLVINGNEPEVKMHTPLETKTLLQHIKQAADRESRSAVNKLH